MTPVFLLTGGTAAPVSAQYAAMRAPAANPVPEISGAAASGPVIASSDKAPGDLFSYNPPLLEFGSQLADRGIYLRGFVQETSYAVASGGLRRGNVAYGEAFYGADFDLQRIVGWKNALLSVSFDSRFGASPSKVGGYSGSTLAFIQGVGPSSATRLNELTIDQHLFQDRVRVIVGRQTLANYFATSTFYCQFEVGLCSNLVPTIVGGDASAPFWPIAVWAGEVSFWPTRTLYARIGASESNPAQYSRGGFPWNRGWSTATATGVFVPAEFGYVTTPDETRYFGKVVVGVTFDSSNVADPRYNQRGQSIAVFGGRARGTGSAVTVYAQGERVVWRPDPRGARGLALLAGIEQSVSGSVPIKTYVVGGAIFSGMVGSRPNDRAGLLLQHHRLGTGQVGYLNDLLAVRGLAGRLHRSETILEANYEAQIARGFRIKPYAALVLHPDQLNARDPDPRLKHAVLLGARMSLYLNPALGLPQFLRPN